ncbi:MAG: hypothetical protein SGPRY_012572, partial [Prymnesium sp.]
LTMNKGKHKFSTFNLSCLKHLNKAMTIFLWSPSKGDPPAISRDDMLPVLMGATDGESMKRRGNAPSSQDSSS